MSNERTIVVGIDGSRPSTAALHWALGQAELTGAAVEAITAWEYPAFYSWEGGGVAPREFEEAAGVAAENTVNAVLGERDSSAPVRTRVVQGHSAQVLLEAAREAELLVVGSRGHGGFVGALLGSVSQKCVQHSTCPVVIVHADPDTTEST